MVNPEWLRYFAALAETHNFSVAAEQLHITPQAMSNAIAGLEQHYKLKLVDRGTRMKGLTPAGEALLKETRTILQRLELADLRMAELREDTPQGPLRLASVSVITNYVLPGLLTTLVEAYPRLRPRLFNMRPAEAERWLIASELDLAVLERPPDSQSLDHAVLTTSPYVIVGRPQPTATWDAFGYVMPRRFQAGGDEDQSCEAEAEIEGKWPDSTHRRRIVAEVEQLETAISLCESGLGVAFLPHVAVAERLERCSLAIVAEPPRPYTETYVATWRKRLRQPPAVQALLDVLLPGKGLSNNK